MDKQNAEIKELVETQRKQIEARLKQVSNDLYNTCAKVEKDCKDMVEEVKQRVGESFDTIEQLESDLKAVTIYISIMHILSNLVFMIAFLMLVCFFLFSIA